jgi:hypothetical protein
MDGPVTLCALFYADYPQLAHRCLNSIWERLPEGRPFLGDVRLGLNQISPATRQVIDWFVANTLRHYGLRVITYDCPLNACKYPLVRRMLLQDPIPPAEWVMWFDDDSFLATQDGWWTKLLDLARPLDMVGSVYTYPMLGQQWEWISRQSWFNPAVGTPPVLRPHRKPAFRFCTGGWWLLRSAVLQKYDWPSLELRHCGGDTMLGELFRHQNLQMGNFSEGVRINADKRRGVSELHLGRNLAAERPNHDFTCERTVYG